MVTAVVTLLQLRLARTERGANLVEYAFLVGLIAVVCLLAVSFFGGATSTKFSANASAFP